MRVRRAHFTPSPAQHVQARHLNEVGGTEGCEGEVGSAYCAQSCSVSPLFQRCVAAPRGQHIFFFRDQHHMVQVSAVYRHPTGDGAPPLVSEHGARWRFRCVVDRRDPESTPPVPTVLLGRPSSFNPGLCSRLGWASLSRGRDIRSIECLTGFDGTHRYSPTKESYGGSWDRGGKVRSRSGLE